MDNLQEQFDCMMSFTPAQITLFELHEQVCKKHYDRIDPTSGMFPDGYYDDMRAIAETLKLKFTDPRGQLWRKAAVERTITVH